MYKRVPEIRETKDAFERIKTDPKKMSRIEAREEAFLEYTAGLAETESKGEKRGEKRGLRKRRAKERAEGHIEAAKNMLSLNFPLETISQACGLDELKSYKGERGNISL